MAAPKKVGTRAHAHFAGIACLFLFLLCIPATRAQLVSSTTSSGSSVSSTVSIPTVSSEYSLPPSETSSDSPSDPPVHHGKPKTYTLSSESSPSVDPTTSFVDPLLAVVIPASEIFQKSSVSEYSVYSSDPSGNESSTIHVVVEKTHFRNLYVGDHSSEWSSSLIEDLESQFSNLDVSVPASDLDSSLNVFDSVNFHDDLDPDEVIGGEFAFTNVMCILSNGTGFQIPGAGCTRKHNHLNICRPLCANSYTPHCTPQCFCRDGFNTATFTGAAIINCTKGYFPVPSRATTLRTPGVVNAVVFGVVPELVAPAIYLYSTSVALYGLPSFGDMFSVGVNAVERAI